MEEPDGEMDKARLIEALTEAHADMEALLASMDEQQMIQPGVYDSRSVKDVLAHLAVWERIEIGRIETSLCGEMPIRYEFLLRELDPRGAVPQHRGGEMIAGARGRASASFQG